MHVQIQLHFMRAYTLYRSMPMPLPMQRRLPVKMSTITSQKRSTACWIACTCARAESRQLEGRPMRPDLGLIDFKWPRIGSQILVDGPNAETTSNKTVGCRRSTVPASLTVSGFCHAYCTGWNGIAPVLCRWSSSMMCTSVQRM